MSYNEAETRFYLIDPVLRGKGYNEHWKLKLETPAPVEPTGAKAVDVQARGALTICSASRLALCRSRFRLR